MVFVSTVSFKRDTSDQAIKSAFDALLISLADCPPCGPTCGEHGCTLHFADHETRQPVADFLYQHGHKKKEARTQTLIDWLRSAKVNGSGHSNAKYHFPVPYVTSEDTPLSPEAEHKLSRHRLCVQTIRRMFNLGNAAWKSVKKQAGLSSVAKKHGNRGKGRPSLTTGDGQVARDLRDFFTQLEKLGEPRATRVVREEVGEVTIRDHDDIAIWLPMTYGKRAVYRMYVRGMGYEVSTRKNGKFVRKWIGEGEQKKIISYATFHKYWALEHGHIKIASRREDVCDKCFVFAQRSRYAAFQNSTCQEIRQSDDMSVLSEFDDEEAPVDMDVDAPDEDAQSNVTEAMILEAVRHVQAAKAQREYLRKREEEAVSDSKNNVSHSERRHCITLDYCMNVEVPHLGAEQPGITYYLQKYNGYILGIVNSAHEFADADEEEKFGHFMNAYLYEEWEGGKGSNNVASLLLKSLYDEGMIQEDADGKPITGGSLSVFCDNCSGQNKNNTVLRMAAFLVECGYFKKVEVVFLIVGHTKNACDRLFNSMKARYRALNVMSFTELLPILNASSLVTVHHVSHKDFQDWTTLFDQYYRKITGILINHIFEVKTENVRTNANGKKSVVMTVREADLPDADPVVLDLKKRGAYNNRLPNEMTPCDDDKPPRNAMKVVVFDKKWKEFIPEQFHSEMCPQPTAEEIEAAKKGKKSLIVKDKKMKKKVLDKLEVDAMEGSKKKNTTHNNKDEGEECVVSDDEDSDDEDSDVEDDNIPLAELKRQKLGCKKRKAEATV